MNNELVVTLESRTNIQDFKEHSFELASLLRNYFEGVKVGSFWVSGVSLNKVINILEAGTIILSYYTLDFTDEDILSSIFTEINGIREAATDTLDTEFNNMSIRLNFECPNTISEITQKLQILEKVITKEEIGINSINMKYAEKVGGPYRALEVVVSY